MTFDEVLLAPLKSEVFYISIPSFAVSLLLAVYIVIFHRTKAHFSPSPLVVLFVCLFSKGND